MPSDHARTFNYGRLWSLSKLLAHIAQEEREVLAEIVDRLADDHVQVQESEDLEQARRALKAHAAAVQRSSERLGDLADLHVQVWTPPAQDEGTRRIALVR